MLKLDKDSIVYIACSANFATGGPELLHQLGAELRDLGFNIFMYYLRFDSAHLKSPVHDNYNKYDLPFVFEVKDIEKNLLLISETDMNKVYQFKNIQYIIWWLSVDNAYVALDLINSIYDCNSLIKRMFCKFIKGISLLPMLNVLYKLYSEYRISNIIYKTKESTRFKHFAQSFYAINHLNSIGVNNVEYLSDYLVDDFIKQTKEIDLSLKQNIVAYNPKKGLNFTKLIIDYSANSICFVPIVNMTIDQVKKLLLVAKVYIDFGNHPGKDRIPREAAMLGCCVFTGLEGSARFNEDVPISTLYKFPNEVSEVPNIVERIKYVFDNYELCCNDFEKYKSVILDEHKLFKQSVARIFRNMSDENISSNNLL